MMSLFHLAMDLLFLFLVVLQPVERSGISVKKSFVTNIQVVFIRRAQDTKNGLQRGHLKCRPYASEW